MDNDRPIVFTISDADNWDKPNRRKEYWIRTRDARADENYTTTKSLLSQMKMLSSKYNNLGYAVLFEVD